MLTVICCYHGNIHAVQSQASRRSEVAWLRLPAELYPCGGVCVRQAAAVVAAGERAEVVQRLHSGQRAGDHGDGAGRRIVGRAPQRQRVVRWAGEAQRVV